MGLHRETQKPSSQMSLGPVSNPSPGPDTCILEDPLGQITNAVNTALKHAWSINLCSTYFYMWNFPVRQGKKEEHPSEKMWRPSPVRKYLAVFAIVAMKHGREPKENYLPIFFLKSHQLFICNGRQSGHGAMAHMASFRTNVTSFQKQQQTGRSFV